jgi:ABC-type glutathione transport system ATPase component
VLELLDGLNDRGITLVVVTHDPNVARRADRVNTLVDGRIVNRMSGRELGEVNPYLAAAEAEEADEEAVAENAAAPTAGDGATSGEPAQEAEEEAVDAAAPAAGDGAPTGEPPEEGEAPAGERAP